MHIGSRTAGAAAPLGKTIASPETVSQSTAMRCMQRQNYSEVIVGAKVADREEMFTARHDKIVIYLNRFVGAAGAHLLASHLAAKFPTAFKSGIVPMTEQVARGVSRAPEVSGQAQWAVGSCFGAVRCNLIAKALLKCLRGMNLTDAQIQALPLDKVAPARSARRGRPAVRPERLLPVRGGDVRGPAH